MEHREGHFEGPDQQTLYYQYWQPLESPTAVLVLAHGAGEHSGRYAHLAEFFVSRGYAVAALDHPGHGRSEGVPGHIDRFDDYLQALAAFDTQVQEAFPEVPLFLLGHSMGGLIAALYLLDNQHHFKGAILSGPAIMSDIQPGALQIFLIRALSVLAPRFGALALDADGVSRDPVEVQRYRDDPLVHGGKMSARKLSELFAHMSRIQEQAHRITLPMLMLHGGADAMTSPEGSRFLDATVSSSDRQLSIYPGLYHEIFNEPEREEIFAEVFGWCEERLPGRRA